MSNGLFNLESCDHLGVILSRTARCNVRMLPVYFIDLLVIILEFYYMLEKLRTIFFKQNAFLKAFSIDYYANISLDNNKLATSSNRVTIPYVFNVFKSYIENTLKCEINLDLNVTPETVRDNDDRMIESFSKPNFSYKNVNLDLLLKASSLSFDELGLMPTSINKDLDSLLAMFPGHTSACYPLYGRKDSEINVKDSKDWVSSFLLDPSYFKILSQPCTIFHRFRTYLSKDLKTNVVKSRPVWGFPLRITLLESVFFRDLIENSLLYNKNPVHTNCATGKTKVNVSSVLSKLRTNCRDIICLDLSKFDSTIPSFFWSLFYSNIMSRYNYSNEELKLLNYLMVYHNYTPYCLRSCKIKFTSKGVCSGSLLTSTFDSFVNRTILNYACLEKTHGKYSSDGISCVMGDDAIIVSKFFGLNYLSKVFERFGMSVNIDKTLVSKWDGNLSFIGYFWNKYNEPYQTLEWYVSHLCVPSRFRRNTDIPVPFLQTSRALSLVSNVKDGLNTFQFLIGFQDKVWKYIYDKYKAGDEPFIYYVGGNEKRLYMKIPVSSLISCGWRCT